MADTNLASVSPVRSGAYEWASVATLTAWTTSQKSGSLATESPCQGRRAPYPLAMIEVIVNGEPRQVAAGATIKDLLIALGLGARPVAVERNRHVVPRAQHDATTLSAGDRLELVTFVGGG